MPFFENGQISSGGIKKDFKVFYNFSDITDYMIVYYYKVGIANYSKLGVSIPTFTVVEKSIITQWFFI